MALWFRYVFFGLVPLVAGCERTPSEPKYVSSAAAPAVSTEADVTDTDRSYRFVAAGRIVAIGDLHGDLAATRKALRVAGVMSDKDSWSGGNTVLVQTGDVLDRGDDERAILDLLDRLEQEAKAAGGLVLRLQGNHEVMNVAGDLRYVTRAGFTTFESVTSPDNPAFAAPFKPQERARALAFAPGGPYALRLARHNTVVMVNDTLFVHGGILSKHIRYGLGRINEEVKAWMRAERPRLPALMLSEDAPTWNRRYSTAHVDARDCRVLATALKHLEAKRMVVGHTPQKGGITSACDDRVWRIDVGLASYYGGGAAQALVIQGDEARVVSE
ncbi:MAG TPA: shewanella-like protein phosphatase [Polyangiaceae bacterium]|jgi:hypothetical protein|nr:MAG: Calcineurin-like phosphoesterase [Deltaproteobacteria bacterium ADurb.Bin207]HNZ21624.1 shewanella-like protein phosphatase [Polyangiaceae bacterium]HOD24148.1 shewanella-like protein phosphatase [Polyangiaceae bacterium]HOE48581.1 shewanella-like protein phosphatase [Polyangiaceae bacterium]HOH02006.1 shewanella-like protein phosphatase [Polyangiaceae bacterium]